MTVRHDGAETRIMTLRDPTAGKTGAIVELLADLTDAEVEEYIEYWQAKRERHQERGDGQGAWWCSKHVSSGRAEQRRREAAL